MIRTTKYTIALLTLFALTGCGRHYVTPGAAATMLAITDHERQAYSAQERKIQTDRDLRAYYATRPASPFPANIAVVRVQDSGYHATSYQAPGRYTVITSRDIESDVAFEGLLSMPDIDGIAPIGRMLVPVRTNSVKDLRVPAAKLHADMLLVYTVDTSFTVDGNQLGPLTTISLGLLRNLKAHVAATVSGILVDVRTGYIYGTTEATNVQEQRTSIWSTELAINTARLRAEKNAFTEFVLEFERLWPDVVLEHKGHVAAVRWEEVSPTGSNRYYELRFDD